jgi:hypothetical protein
VLQSHALAPWPLVEYIPPEPFAGWIEHRLVQGRKEARKKRKMQGIKGSGF